MEINFTQGWYNQKPATAEVATDCDARVFGGQMVVCEFAGHEFDPDKKRKCKMYERSKQRSYCMYYRDTITIGACDNIKER